MSHIQSTDWWEGAAERDRVESMLLRAGVLTDDDYFHEKPWKWSVERLICDKLEAVMRDAGVPPEQGWGMTMLEVLQAGLDAHP